MSELIDATRASESQHWYTKDGAPAYTIIGANGKERSTTLRDARRHNLFPSVTTIIRCAAAPALERWKRNQMMLAALTLPRKDGEGESDWLKRVEIDSREHARQAAERGTNIHAIIQNAFEGRPFPIDVSAYVEAARTALASSCGVLEWVCERSFAHPLGYGGKNDLLATGSWIVDIKTKEFDASHLPSTFDDHAMQLAAYRRGLNEPTARCAILFVSVSVPGLAIMREIDETQLTRFLAAFDALLAYWQAINSYKPTN